MPATPHVSDPERTTQDRVVALLTSPGVGYDDLGDWQHRPDNSNVEEKYLRSWLLARGHSDEEVDAALYQLRAVAALPTGEGLLKTNQEVYDLLRHGADVQTEAGSPKTSVQFIDWENPERNTFGVAQEVTLTGGFERRPDVVLYLNGIAVAVVELKSARNKVDLGVRQSISNQRPEFNAWFYTTVQLVFAGNDSALRYGTVGTPAKFWTEWKENPTDTSRLPLDKYLALLCDKSRLIELIRDFVIFDGGVKKVPRAHQYLGIKEAQQFVDRREGGVLWHTQGSGKSILMVLLARWILRTNPDARVVIVTDRDDLDRQIENVFRASGFSGKTVKRTQSAAQLRALLKKPNPRLICSLVHKFGARATQKDTDAFLAELSAESVHTVGDVFVFVDEAHRTQSGSLHKAMKALMPNATFLGFTGTPLLKRDKKTTLEVFGRYIHTYNFKEGVADKVVLDLVYEARDIDQELDSSDEIDEWFEIKTRGLSSWQRDRLKKEWATKQRVVSSQPRMRKVVKDVVMDFSRKARLASGRGTAILVASSILDACRYFKLFQDTSLAGRCAIITSYTPHQSHVSLEDIGANTATEKQFVYDTYRDLLDQQKEQGRGTTQQYEKWAKEEFIERPAQMQLLIVVDKLLTGFDAPSCSYLYIDKSMRDHALFQAICRVNRLDTPDKTVGNIVDYKDLFHKVENALAVYTGELDHDPQGADPDVLLRSRLAAARERIDQALEALSILVEPIDPPGDMAASIHHFCGNPELEDDLKEHAPLREALYQHTAALLRGFDAIDGAFDEAGYTSADAQRIEQSKTQFAHLRDVIKNASGEYLELKDYEADMRYLLDMYVEARSSRPISAFKEGRTLLEIVQAMGMARAIDELGMTQTDKEAVASTIVNNTRAAIVRKRSSDPSFYGRMSSMLSDVIKRRRADALSYEQYLAEVERIISDVQRGADDDTPDVLTSNPALRALYNALTPPHAAHTSEQALDLSQQLHRAILGGRPHKWRDNDGPRERSVKGIMHSVLGDQDEVERLFPIVYAQTSTY